MTGQNFLLPCLGLSCLIAINAFFTAAEFSIVSVRRSRISQLVKDGDIQAQTVQSLQKGIERLLSTTQLGITFSSLALGWIGEQTMAVVIAKLIAKLPLSETIIKSISTSLAIPLAFVCLVYFQIVLGELVPKSIALLYPERLARFFAPPSLVIAKIFRPFLEILNSSTRYLLKLCGIKYTAQGWYEQLTLEELQLIIATEKESTGLEAEQRELLNNILEFGEVDAVEIMIPRTQIKFLSQDATFAELLQKIATDNYFRYPIIGNSLDDIKGIIDYKSLVIPLVEGKLNNDSVITSWIKPVNFVSEATPIREVLSSMQKSQEAMAIVIDEFGGTSGLITLQDIITEIIGNQDNLASPATKFFKKLDNDTFLISAQMNLEDVNEKLQIDLPLGDDYYTLSGFLQEQWQKIPSQGETLDYGNLKFTVIAIDNNRLEQIKIQIQKPYNHRYHQNILLNGDSNSSEIAS